MPLFLARFEADREDPRPMKWPIRHPCWVTGTGDTYNIVMAYVESEEELLELWPEAKNIDWGPPVDKYVFTDRFPRPEWLKNDTPFPQPVENKELSTMSTHISIEGDDHEMTSTVTGVVNKALLESGFTNVGVLDAKTGEPTVIPDAPSLLTLIKATRPHMFDRAVTISAEVITGDEFPPADDPEPETAEEQLAVDARRDAQEA